MNKSLRQVLTDHFKQRFKPRYYMDSLHSVRSSKVILAAVNEYLLGLIWKNDIIGITDQVGQAGTAKASVDDLIPGEVVGNVFPIGERRTAYQ